MSTAADLCGFFSKGKGLTKYQSFTLFLNFILCIHINRYMFFSDNGDVPKIERALLDGTERFTFDIDGLVTPESLEADIFEQRVYIVDTGAEKILSCDYNGKDSKSLRRLSNSILTDVAVFRVNSPAIQILLESY